MLVAPAEMVTIMLYSDFFNVFNQLVFYYIQFYYHLGLPLAFWASVILTFSRQQNRYFVLALLLGIVMFSNIDRAITDILRFPIQNKHLSHYVQQLMQASDANLLIRYRQRQGGIRPCYARVYSIESSEKLNSNNIFTYDLDIKKISEELASERDITDIDRRMQECMYQLHLGSIYKKAPFVHFFARKEHISGSYIIYGHLNQKKHEIARGFRSYHHKAVESYLVRSGDDILVVMIDREKKLLKIISTPSGLF